MHPFQLRLNKAFKTKGLARTRDLEAVGVSRSQLHRLCAQGYLSKVDRGLYQLASVMLSEKIDVASAAIRVPEGVICLLSALRFHVLTTQNPWEIWMAIGSKAWRPKMGHPPLRIIHMREPALSTGVETHILDGIPVRITNPAKTVVDCFKFRNQIGIDVGIEALRDYRYNKHGSDALFRMAKLMRMWNVMRPYAEMAWS